MKTFAVFLMILVAVLQPQPARSEILTNRSIAVTELDIVSRFSLETVLEHLIAQNQSQLAQTPLELFLQWAETNTVCDPVNGFPLSCRENDFLDDQLPFEPDTFAYKARGLFNRFDLASEDGSDCGEYRIVFTRDNTNVTQVKTLIFEARLPNIHPQQGVAGCADVINFWAGLSAVDDNSARADALVDFYFNGIGGFPPVIHPAHYQRQTGSGQIRTNSFLSDGIWSLREYGLRNQCEPDCRLVFVPQATTDNPAVSLAQADSSNAFQDLFIASLTATGSGLLTDDLNTFSFPVPEEFNAAEALMTSLGGPLAIANIAGSASTQFKTRVQQQLDSIGSPLTATQVLNRANITTCNGCHQTAIGANIGPDFFLRADLLFRHVTSSVDSSDAPDGPRFLMSSALKQNFLPFRKQHMENFLADLLPIDVTFAIINEWDTGYCAQVDITQTGSQTVAWTLVVDVTGSVVDNQWGGEFTASEEGLLITAPAWAQSSLSAGSVINLGFCGSKTASQWAPELVSVRT